MLNLFLAVFWLVVAAVLFALPWLRPEAAPVYIPRTQLSMGWFALCLCVYNVARWWSTRRSAKDQAWLRYSRPRRRFYDQGECEPPSRAETAFTEHPPRQLDDRTGGPP